MLEQKKKPVKVLPRDLRPDLPAAAQAAILKALSPDPRDRYRRAVEFGDALARALLSGYASEEPISTETYPPKNVRPAGRTFPRRSVLAAAAVTIPAAAAGLWLGLRPHPPDSIAVLPFENRAGDPEIEYISQGITESLINDLSRIPTLRVSALGSVRRYDTAWCAARYRAWAASCVSRPSWWTYAAGRACGDAPTPREPRRFPMSSSGFPPK
jgi:hypothetical protein